jgi:hypothetical protein
VPYQPPPDLIELRRSFVAAEQQLRDLAASHPAPTAIAAGEASLSDAQREEWAAVHNHMRQLAEQIQQHPWLAGADNRHHAWMAMRAAAEG